MLSHLEEACKKLSDSLPEQLGSMKADIEKNFKSILQATFSKMDLVTREEFDAQSKVLARTRKMLDELEKEIAALKQ